MALEAAGILLWLSNHAILVDRFGSAEDAAPHVFLVPGYATVGAVIAARSRNRIGWLFLAFGLAAALLTFAIPYYMRGTVIAPGSLPPAAASLESLGSVLWPSTYLFLGLLLLVFPDGRLPSPRWRPVALVYVTSWVLLMLNAVVKPTTDTIHGISHTNPLAIQALSHPTWKAVIQGISVIAVAGLAVVALAPLVRFRRAGPVQRQQLKWFTFVVGGCIASVLTQQRSSLSYPLSPGGWQPSRPPAWLWGFRSPSAWPSCATGCTTSTGSSAAPWSMPASP